jgi:D-alanyl-D-alanine carboxypeptidase (penicillin-binding protein 5/6)
MRTFRSAVLAIFFLFTISLTAYALPEIDIQAKSALLVEPVSGEVLYAENENQKVYPASVTKIMTAMLAIENGKMTDVVTVSETSGEGIDPSGSSVSPALQTGEQLTLEDLLYCILVASDNRACNVVAEHIAGSVDAFVGMMNAEANKLGCTGTHFANPHGLHDENHYTTAYDLYLITLEAVKNPVFTKICNTESKTIAPTNKTDEERVFYTTNYLISKLKQPGYIYYPAKGIKTGHTTPAGHCLVSMAEKNNLILISVVMGADVGEDGNIYSFSETSKLFEWGFNNFTNMTLIKRGEGVAENKVTLAEDKDYVMAQTAGSIEAIVPADFDVSKLTREITLTYPDGIEAPVKKGQALGTVKLSYNGREYGTLSLVAANDVARSETLYLAKRVRDFLSQRWLWYTAGGVLLLIILYTILMIRYNVRRRRTSSRRGYQGKRRYR